MSAPGPFVPPDPQKMLIGAGIYLAVIFLLMRVSPALAITLLLLGLLGTAAYLMTPVIRGMFRGINGKIDGEQAYRNRVMVRYRDCQRKEEQFRTETENIRKTIAGLRTDIERSTTADAGEIERAQTLIKEFEAEFNLRHAKAAFFAECATKLKALLDRHQLQQSITNSKRQLDKLRASNFDDEATLEETRFHLERDTIELDTIAELSKEAFVSFKAEQAEELRERLDKLRGEL